MAKQDPTNYTPALAALSLGYEDFDDAMTELEAAYSAADLYPPYNIKRPDASTYIIEVAVPGYKEHEVHSYMENGFLYLKADGLPGAELTSDTYDHEGMWASGPLDVKFIVHERLSLDWAHFENGEVIFHFTDKTNRARVDVVIGDAASTQSVVVEYDSAGSPVHVYTEVDAAPDNSVVVNADDSSKPTTEIVLPDPMPQVVQVTNVDIVPNVDPKADEPQATITVAPATEEVHADDVTTSVVKTEEGKSDIVVAVPTEVVQAAQAAGIDITADVHAAIASSDIPAPEAPAPEATSTTDTTVTPADGQPDVTIKVPDVIPQVVEVKVDTPADAAPVVTLEPVATDIPEDHTVIPMVTAEGSPDIVATVSPETQAKLDDAGIDLTHVAEAVKDADPVVATVDNPTPDVPAPEAPVADVPAPEAQAPEAPAEAPAETTVAVVHADDPATPTVAVQLPDPLPENAVLDVQSVAPSVDPASPVPQVTLTVADADHVDAPAVAPDAAPVVVETPDANPDVTVTPTPEAQAVLDEHGLDANTVVQEAVAQTEVAPPVADAPTLAPADTTAVVVNADNPEVPTVAVQLPDPMPQVAEVSVQNVVDNVDPASAQPQAVLTVTDATQGTSTDSVVTQAVPTPDGSADVVVATPTDVHEELAAQGIDPNAAVAAAIAQSDVAPPALPEVSEPTADPVTVEVPATDSAPAVQVTTPPEVTPVMAATVDTSGDVPAVTLTDSSASVDPTHDVLPVETPEGQANVMVTVAPADAQALADQGVDVQAAVSDALQTADVTATATTDPAPADAPVDPAANT